MTWHWTREHEEHEREDEAVVPVPECVIIFPERIDPGKKQEQRHESNRDERDKADACLFSHGAVRHTRGIPVRDHLVGEYRVRGGRDEMRPAMIANRMRFMPGVGFRWVMKMGEVPGPGWMEMGLGNFLLMFNEGDRENCQDRSPLQILTRAGSLILAKSRSNVAIFGIVCSLHVATINASLGRRA
jgi:hypothetical protein